MDSRHGLVIHVTADAPPGKARTTNRNARIEYWEHGKRLPQGGLVAVVTKDKQGPSNTGHELNIAVAILTMSE